MLRNTYSQLNVRQDIQDLIGTINNTPIGQFAKLITKKLRKGDKYTYEHSIDVMQLSLKMGLSSGKNKRQILILYYAALLHDIGKIKIPNQILNKSGPLSTEEYNIIKEHPATQVQLMAEFNSSIPDNLKYIWDEIQLVASQHHEKANGTGYPKGLVSHEIHDLSKIISIADSWSAIRSQRSYDDAEQNLSHAISRMENGIDGSGSKYEGSYDKNDLQRFISLVRNGTIDSIIVPPLRNIAEFDFYRPKPYYLSFVDLVQDLPSIYQGYSKLDKIIKQLDIEELEMWVQHFINTFYLSQKLPHWAGTDRSNQGFLQKTKKNISVHMIKSNYFETRTQNNAVLDEWVAVFKPKRDYISALTQADAGLPNYSFSTFFMMHEKYIAFLFLRNWQIRLNKMQ